MTENDVQCIGSPSPNNQVKNNNMIFYRCTLDFQNCNNLNLRRLLFIIDILAPTVLSRPLKKL